MRPKVHVKKGDEVLVIAGKDKGKRGKVQAVFPKEGRVIVEGVNIVKRHVRPNPQMMQGGIIEKPAPIHASNVMIWCSNCNAPRRINKRSENGKKVRVCNKCGTSFDD
ncbi:MAG: 50S ribosomal protein L24 [Bacillota bacterium]|nr:MAG: 50S ribosomal protein L24 [Bacillota bacterium]